MITKIVELTNLFNWGKFMVAKFDRREWATESQVEKMGPSLLSGRGWTPKHIWVLDLQTGEGALFRPPGSVQADLDKHAVWVCPMFEVFLNWLYQHPEYWEDIESIPSYLELTDKETNSKSALYGYRRPGPSEAERKAKVKETEMKPRGKKRA